MIPPIQIPADAKCQEASIFSTVKYIPCGKPATAIVYSERDERGYYMCAGCASHNIANRGGKLVVGASCGFRYVQTLGAEIEKLTPNRLRCNGRVGFVKGNQKGYCKKRGAVVKITIEGENPRLLCPECWAKWEDKHKD